MKRAIPVFITIFLIASHPIMVAANQFEKKDSTLEEEQKMEQEGEHYSPHSQEVDDKSTEDHVNKEILVEEDDQGGEIDSDSSREIREKQDSTKVRSKTKKVTTVFPLAKGDRHNRVIEVKKMLNGLDFGGIKVTDFFGSFTEKRIRQFQEFIDIPVTGQVDEETFVKLEEYYHYPFRKGVRHPQTINLKKKLNRLGFGNIRVTELYGSFTVKKVEDFQKYHDLKVTGIADEETIDKIDELLNNSLQKGSHSDQLISLKKKMNWMGYGNILVTPYFGSFMEKKLKDFQKDYQLPVNGLIDDLTWQKIDEAFNQSMRKGARHKGVLKLKRQLNHLGFGKIKETTLFGSFTAKKVKEFQIYYGLNPTGHSDLVMLDYLDQLINSPYQKGKRHKDIKNFKRQLNELGFGNIKMTTFFGSFMEKRLKEFQKHYGLKVTGIIDEPTERALNEASATVLKKGIRHQDVIQLKKDLNRLGFGNIKVSTLYGSFMEKRVKEFQRHYGLNITGIADAKTLDKMSEILSSPLQKGKRHPDTIKLKENLNRLGFGKIKETSYFGDFMEKKVKEFQRRNNLPVSGIIDEITYDRINNGVVRIFIDPGHGGHDPGAMAFGLNEKDVVLDIALQTAQSLLNNYYGVDVKLSRVTDTFIKLENRAKMANDWGATYFISIHNNSFNGYASGFETYIHNGNVSSFTKEKQNQIHNYLIRQLKVNDRGKKKANFNVLRNTEMPAILVEYLFIDNRVENLKLASSNYRKLLGTYTADALAKAFDLRNK